MTLHPTHEAERVCDWMGGVQLCANQLFLPSWALLVEWVNLIHEGYGDLFDSKEQGCESAVRFSLGESCAQSLRDQCREPQCECLDGSLRDFREYHCGENDYSY